MSTSTQDMVRPGPCVDLYYYDGETHKKQCFPTTQNTKYVQNFQNLQGGSSVFTIPPQMGIQDVVLEMGFPIVPTGTGLALPRGWGYGLIKQVSFRYGGSSQYFLTGDQVLQNALRRQSSRSSANDILTLGGQYADATGGTVGGQVSNNITTAVQTALVVLTLPHSIPSGVGKSHPFPSDLLTQQIQVTVELFPVNQIWTTNTAGTQPPTTLSFAQFQVQQVILNNQGDALARRVDMANNAYAFPAEFVQQKQTITSVSLNNTTSPQEVVLTGFRSGEVKALQVWLTRSSETALNTSAGGTLTATTYLPNKWYLPTSVVMSYAGDVYARYDYGSSLIWNLINGNKAPVVDTVSIVPGNGPTPTAFLSQYVELPFAQTCVDEDSHNTLVHGKPITNGIINLTIAPPSSQTDWVVNVSYVYNTTLLMSQGTCDFVF